MTDVPVEPRSEKPLKEHWLQILLALAAGDRHGLDIMRQVAEATGGHVRLWPGKLYGSLRRLQERGWTRETDGAERSNRGGNPRYYRLTGAGRDRLRRELERLESIVERARERRLLGPAGSGRGER